MAMAIPYLIVSVWTLVFIFLTTLSVFQTLFPYKSQRSGQWRMTGTLASALSTGAGMYALVLLGS
ncbi:MAG TPA: hypothetical protein VK111_03015 [Virgibacillus sp.]|nr:hypothetical protein [Virgibacillus sp.]